LLAAIIDFEFFFSLFLLAVAADQAQAVLTQYHADTTVLFIGKDGGALHGQ
jgi:hypothetical protein